MIPTIQILVVDDEPDVQPLFRQKFRKELKSQNVGLTFALSAPEALDYLNAPEQREQLSVIISDINMPEMTGLELLKIIKTQYPHVDVVMMSAYSDEETQSVALQEGASAFIAKPVDFKSLKDELVKIKNKTLS